MPRGKKPFSAIVPVAGTGTRLKPHTNTYPKVLLMVGHKPILGHIIDQLLEIGTPKVYFIIGHMGEKIREYVGKNYPGLEAQYVEQKEQRGLGHAVWLTSKFIDGPVFILLGDTILSADMHKFVDFRQDYIGVREVPDPRRFGVVEAKNGYVSTLVEKPAEPKSKLAIVGAYSFKDSAALFKSLNEIVAAGRTTKGEIQLTDAIMDMVRKGAKIRPLPINGWYDCGKPETLLATNRFLLQAHRRKLSVKSPGSLIIPPVYIAHGTSIENSIIGPCVSICEGVRITSSIISDSIINERAQIRNAVLTQSLIGPGALFSGRKQQINIGENSEIVDDYTPKP